jgi:hypothetical protein
MERQRIVQFESDGFRRDYSEIERLLKTRNWLESPEVRWIAEVGESLTELDKLSPVYQHMVESYNTENLYYNQLRAVYDSMLEGTDLPDIDEESIKRLFIRFPPLSHHLGVHLELDSAHIDRYMEAMYALADLANFTESEYVLKSAQNDMVVSIPYNDQFEAARYIPYEITVPPQPAEVLEVDDRTLINVSPVTVPHNYKDVVSAQCEVDLSRPLAVVFEVEDNDPRITQTKRVRWDEQGTSFTSTPIGLYNGNDLIVWDQSIGIKTNKEYLMLKNGIIYYATKNCYVTVICDGKSICTRDRYVFGTTKEFGIWRYEAKSKRLLHRTGGQPHLYQDYIERMRRANSYEMHQYRFVGNPTFVDEIAKELVFDVRKLYLGHRVKRNKILNSLLHHEMVHIRDYWYIFVRSHHQSVYFGAKKLIVGEKKKSYPGERTEFRRYPTFYEKFRQNCALKIITDEEESDDPGDQ